MPEKMVDFICLCGLSCELFRAIIFSKGMINSYDNQMPRSVSDAFSRLHGMLNDSKLPQEVIDTIIRYVNEEMRQSFKSKVYDNKINLIELFGLTHSPGTGG